MPAKPVSLRVRVLAAAASNIALGFMLGAALRPVWWLTVCLVMPVVWFFHLVLRRHAKNAKAEPVGLELCAHVVMQKQSGVAQMTSVRVQVMHNPEVLSYPEALTVLESAREELVATPGATWRPLLAQPPSLN